MLASVPRACKDRLIAANLDDVQFPRKSRLAGPIHRSALLLRAGNQQVLKRRPSLDLQPFASILAVQSRPNGPIV